MRNPNDHLNAISWKCEQLGISYGKLMQQISPRELRMIYKEYEALRYPKPESGPKKEDAPICARSCRVHNLYINRRLYPCLPQFKRTFCL